MRVLLTLLVASASHALHVTGRRAVLNRAVGLAAAGSLASLPARRAVAGPNDIEFGQSKAAFREKVMQQAKEREEQAIIDAMPITKLRKARSQLDAMAEMTDKNDWYRLRAELKEDNLGNIRKLTKKYDPKNKERATLLTALAEVDAFAYEQQMSGIRSAKSLGEFGVDARVVDVGPAQAALATAMKALDTFAN